MSHALQTSSSLLNSGIVLAVTSCLSDVFGSQFSHPEKLFFTASCSTLLNTIIKFFFNDFFSCVQIKKKKKVRKLVIGLFCETFFRGRNPPFSPVRTSVCRWRPDSQGFKHRWHGLVHTMGWWCPRWVRRDQRCWLCHALSATLAEVRVRTEFGFPGASPLQLSCFRTWTVFCSLPLPRILTALEILEPVLAGNTIQRLIAPLQPIGGPCSQSDWPHPRLDHDYAREVK